MIEVWQRTICAIKGHDLDSVEVGTEFDPNPTGERAIYITVCLRCGDQIDEN